MIKVAVELNSAMGDCFLQDVAMTDLFAKTQSWNNLKDFYNETYGRLLS